MADFWNDIVGVLSESPTLFARAGAFLALLVLGLVIHAFAFRLIQRYAETGDGRHAARYVASLKWPTRLLAIAIAAGLAIPILDLSSSVAAAVQRAAYLMTVFSVGWTFFRTVRALRERAERLYPIDMAENLRNRKIRTQVGMLARIAQVAIVVLSGAIMLMSIPAVREFGVSLLASAGIAGLVMGIAARSVLSNLIAGVQVALTQPIRIDDVVIVEKEWGWIEEITMTYVVVRIWDKRRLIVPLSHFIEHPFENWTRQTADILGSVFLHVDYLTPVEAVRKKFEAVTKASDYWDGRVCVLHVTESKERTMEIRLLASAATSPKAWELRCEIREAMIAWLQDEHPDCLPRARIELRRGETERATAAAAAE